MTGLFAYVASAARSAIGIPFGASCAMQRCPLVAPRRFGGRRFGGCANRWARCSKKPVRNRGLNPKHGRYTAEAIARRRDVSGLLRAMKALAVEM